MKTLLYSIAILTITSTAAQFTIAEEKQPSSEGFSTVKLFFLNQLLPDAAFGDYDTSGNIVRQGGAMGGGLAPSPMQFEVARLYLNEKFISDAIIRHVDVKPQLNLLPGDHKIRIESDGYEKYERAFTVLQNGSVQWLVIKLDRLTVPKNAAGTSTTTD